MMNRKLFLLGIIACFCIVAGVAAVDMIIPETATFIQHSEATITSERDQPDLRSNAVIDATKLNSPVKTRTATPVTSRESEYRLSAVPQRADAIELSPYIADLYPAITSADKEAALARRQADNNNTRPPANPLDQGTESCPGTDLISLIGSVSGTTNGFVNNFGPFASQPANWNGYWDANSHAGPDVAYKWTAPAAGDYTFSTCPNDYDTGISLWNYTCPTNPAYPGSFLWGNDDGGVCVGDFGSQIDCITLTADQQILIVIDGYGTGSGPYTLTISSCSPCEVECTNTENEPDCFDGYIDNTNGGCNSTPVVFSELTGNCPWTVCGENGTYNNDTLRDTDWYRVVLADTQLVVWSFVSEDTMQLFVVGPGPVGFECDSLVLYGGPFNAFPCDTTVISGCLPAGEYWFFVGAIGTAECGTEYHFTIECLECCEPEFFADVDCDGATPAITGNTTGGPDPCLIGIPTDIWEIEILEDGLYNFSACGGTNWDSFIWISDQCCGDALCADDDGCGTVGGLSIIECCDLTAGTYYLHVSGFSATDFGPYTVAVTCCPPCVVTCANNEAEPDCETGFEDNTNGGCNSTPPVYGGIVCGDTICGTSGTFQIDDTTNGRDTDWYELTLVNETYVVWNAIAEFPVQLFIISPGDGGDPCEGLGIAGGDTAVPCTLASVAACLEAGTYWLFISTTFSQVGILGVECGANYSAWVECSECPAAGPTECPEELTMYAEPTDRLGDPLTVAAADSSVQGIFRRWDNYSGATDSICDVHWWGCNLQFTGTFSECLTEDPMTFLIAFHPDSAGRPAAAATCSYTVSAARQATPDVFTLGNPPFTATNFYYSVDLPTCCFLQSGWLTIRGISVGPGQNCLFYWTSSGGPTGGQSWLRSGAGALTTQAFNLSKCITRAPIPCLPVTDLRVYLTLGNGNAKLDWIAPQAGNYDIYATTSPNAPDYPDAAWIYLDTQVVGAPGAATWTDPGAFANYKRYLVVHNCD